MSDFNCLGIVHPLEYNWKKQMEQIAKEQRKNYRPYKELDVGKIIGLCRYIEELEKKIRKQKSAVKFYKRYYNTVFSITGYDLFKKEQPKIYKKWITYLRETKLCACIYNSWLFNHCFRDMIDQEVKEQYHFNTKKNKNRSNTKQNQNMDT